MKKSIRALAMLLALIVALMMFPLTASAASYKPGKTKITSISHGKVSKATNRTTVTLKWKKVKKATGYEIYELNDQKKWVCIKKTGKNVTTLRVKKEYAGRRSFKVRAVRKVKKKTCRGSFSAVKRIFIPSPLTLEKLFKIEGEATEQTEKIADGLVMKMAVKGNTVICTFDVSDTGKTKQEVIDALKSMDKDLEKTFVGICKTARLDGGVRGVKVNVRLICDGRETWTKTYKE